MSRIQPVTHISDPELKDLFTAGEAFMGFLPNDGLLMAHRPGMLKIFFELVKEVYAPGKVDSGLKKLIGHIASTAAGCRYCSAHTAFAVMKQGVPDEQLKEVWDFENSNVFDAAEKAALRVALKAGMVPNQVTDADMIELQKYFDEEGVVEIVGVISLFGFLNRWNTTLDTQLEELPQTFYESLKNQNT